jgi:hypothetical protein
VLRARGRHLHWRLQPHALVVRLTHHMPTRLRRVSGQSPSKLLLEPANPMKACHARARQPPATAAAKPIHARAPLAAAVRAPALKALQASVPPRAAPRPSEAAARSPARGASLK